MPLLAHKPLKNNAADAESQLSRALAPAPRALRLAYLFSRYPGISHTFFLHEVLGLRLRGLDIETASINPPDRPLNKLSEAEATEAASTCYIKSTRWTSAMFAVLATAVTRPTVLLRGLRAVCELRGLTLRQRGRWLFYLIEAVLVGRWMRERKLEHLHVHFGGPVASVGMLTSVAWKIPYSLTIHGPEELLNAEAHQLREKLHQACLVVCISDFCRSQLCQLLPPEAWPKLVVARLGVDPVVLAPQDRKPSTEGRLTLVCTGRLVAEKGHRILLEALLQLHQRGCRVHATMIGDGPERAELEAFVKLHDLEGWIHFTSALSHAETLAHVRRADIFALASFAEGVPVALMEAMALGVPCVSTTIAGIPELIGSGSEGMLVAPANVGALADAIEMLAQDPGLRLRLAAAARQRIINDYNLPLNHELLSRILLQHLQPSSTSERFQ